MGENTARLPKAFTLTGSSLYDRIVARVRKRGWEAVKRHGDTVKAIAERAQVGERTVERFIWGDTINPLGHAAHVFPIKQERYINVMFWEQK